MTIKELKALRIPALETRALNRAKGDKMDVKVENACNGELMKLNLAIQGVQPYAQKKKKPAKKGDPLA